MFTGLIEEIGLLRDIKRSGDSMVLKISAKNILSDVNIGDSISLNGICLTVTQFDKSSFSVDVMPETLYKTSLSELKTGSKVNLERAMRASDRFGGHFVAGHVDGLATLVDKKTLDNAIYLKFKVDSSLLKYMISKGSIAIDGISLTIVKVENEYLTVSIIPHTLQNTNLIDKDIGMSVNIEVDMLGKYVENLLLNYADKKINENITAAFLEENGF